MSLPNPRATYPRAIGSGYHVNAMQRVEPANNDLRYVGLATVLTFCRRFQGD